jgi:hypothetical protein
VHASAIVAEALRLRDDEGLGARRVARRMGLPVATVRDWHAGKVPRRFGPNGSQDGGPRECCPDCGQEQHAFDVLPYAYVYLLGLYLCDGTISTHPRGVYRLRIFLDKRYPAIVDACHEAIGVTMPANRVERRLSPSNCFEVSSYSRAWPCLFPQHGPGPKHQRRLWLADWQQRLAEQWPEALLRGLVQSDGARFINSGRGGWRHPRYSFANVSTDITSIFCSACDRLGLRWTAAFPSDERKAVTIYVSRKADVAVLDRFIGPKA